jgi:hypothetical protein
MHLSPDHLLAAGCAGPNEWPRGMADRERVLAILQKRFPAATADQLAAAANALVGLKGEWCEVTSFHSVEGRRFKLYERVGD